MEFEINLLLHNRKDYLVYMPALGRNVFTVCDIAFIC